MVTYYNNEKYFLYCFEKENLCYALIAATPISSKVDINSAIIEYGFLTPEIQNFINKLTVSSQTAIQTAKLEVSKILTSQFSRQRRLASELITLLEKYNVH